MAAVSEARKGAGRGNALLRFAGVAGAGWLLDALVLLAAVAFASLPAMLANILSSLVAASFVYLVSHHHVHHGPPGTPAIQLALYILYTLLVILAASAAIGLFVPPLARLLPEEGAVLAAKILVTPPQFACNFLVSRLLARHSFGGAA